MGVSQNWDSKGIYKGRVSRIKGWGFQDSGFRVSG